MTYLEVDGEGVSTWKLKSALTPETVLVSIQQANQEIGTLQDIKAIADICHDKEVLYHADATHTFRRVPLDVWKIAGGPADDQRAHHPRAEGSRRTAGEGRNPVIQMDGRRVPGVQSEGRSGEHPGHHRFRQGGGAGDRRGERAHSGAKGHADQAHAGSGRRTPC